MSGVAVIWIMIWLATLPSCQAWLVAGWLAVGGVGCIGYGAYAFVQGWRDRR